MTDDGPLGRARQALLDAKTQVALKDNPSNRDALELAQVHMDFLLDTLPIPPTPGDPGAHTPGSPVSLAYNTTGQDEAVLSLAQEILALQEDECNHGDESSEGEQ